MTGDCNYKLEKLEAEPNKLKEHGIKCNIEKYSF